MKDSHSRFAVAFFEDSIDILYDGEPFLTWHRREWEEDPEVVFSIANAVKMAAEGDEALLKKALHPLRRVV